MRSARHSALALTVLSLYSSLGLSSAHPHPHGSPGAGVHSFHRRNIIYNGQIADSYDFVVVGGGIAGLVVASRLSEDQNVTVLVLEAGDTGDAVSDQINVPGNTYYESLLHSSYDWAYNSIPQPNAAGRSLYWPRGKVLGGSSAVNGMYLVRPSEIEVDAWAALAGSGSSAGIVNASAWWGWDAMFAAFKTSETFSAPDADCQQTAGIEYVAASRGTGGPLHASYPGYTFPIVGDWTPSLNALGVPPTDDAYSGQGWGGFVATSSINPANWTRSYARSAYIDPLPPRSNLAVLPNATVTQITFAPSTNGTATTDPGSTNLTAVSVQFASGPGAPVRSVNVTREVLLAGGTIGSPQVLMLSGVGPADVLGAAGVPVQVALPGVGQHVQDHISTEILYSTSDATAATIHTAEVNNGSLPANGQSSPFLSYINSATAYVNVTTLFAGAASAATFQSQIASELAQSASSIVPSTDPTVIAGYEAIYNVTANTLLESPVGQVEILLSLTGAGAGNDQTVAIQVALQHPYSHGQIYINSTDPFAYPVINPNYLAHSADLTIMRQGLKLARTLGSTPPLSNHLTGELSPGTAAVVSDEDWETWLAKTIGTEYHPAGSCAMLPLEQGGVVGPDLRVYGLANVRVVDASVFPIVFSAHLGAPTYALGEQAASLIKNFYNPPPPPASNDTASTSTGPASPTETNNNLGHNGALPGARHGALSVLSSALGVSLVVAFLL